MHYPGLHLHFLANRELNELYASIAIRHFALSMISIFIPIFLLKIGFTITQTLAFYTIITITHAFFSLPVAKIAGKYGFKHLIIFSIPLRLIFYSLLYTLEHSPLFFFILPLIIGIERSLFWTGYHVDFAKFSDQKNRARELGTAKIIISLATITGPLLGGLFITNIGFNFLLILVSLLLILSIFPLILSSDKHEKIDTSLKGIFRGQKIKDFFSFLGHGIEGAVFDTIWPIFIFFIILNNYTSLGTVHTLSLIFSLLFIIIIGKLADKNRRKILRAGALINSLIWIMKYNIKTAFQVFTIDSLQGISKKLINIPFNALGYDKANKDKVLRFIVFREFSVNLGSAILFFIMIFIANLKISFFIGVGASLLYMLF